MKKEFVYDGSGIPCIRYVEIRGPVCTVELGSFVGVDVDPVHSVFGIVTDITSEGVKVHSGAKDGPSWFSFSEIEDIKLVSERKDVLFVSDIIAMLKQRYGNERVHKVLCGERVDLDA